MIPPSATVPIMHPTSTEISFAALLLKVSTGSTDLEKREWSALIGIVTAIIGNILISFALNIQRYAHIKLGKEQDQRNSRWGSRRGSQPGSAGYGTEQAQIAAKRAELNLNAPAYDEDDAGHRARYHEAGDHDGLEEYSPRSRSSSESSTKGQTQSTSYLKSPYWWAGILLMITGEAGNFLAYGFAPASIVSPLGVVALVSNCIIAPCLLKERFRQRDLWGVVVAVGGAVTVVLSAETSENKKSPRDVWVAITRWEFELYLGISSLLIVLFLWASGRYGHKSLLIDLGLAGLFGAYTVLSTKGIASMLSDTLWRALTFPITYLLLLILVASALLQIHYVNRALQRFDSTQVIPTQFVLFTISVIIGSAVLYRDFESATADRFAKFIGGCALTFLGVYLITSGRANSTTKSADQEAGDEEEGIGLIDEEQLEDEREARKEVDAQHGNESLHNVKFYDGNMNGESRAELRQKSSKPSLPQTPRRLGSYDSAAVSDPVTTANNDSELHLPKNPWKSLQENAKPRLKLQSTISTPVLRPEAHDFRPSTQRTTSQQGPGPLVADRPRTLTRRSIARMLPGPLISPLSSGLSAVVADEIRRSLDSPTYQRRPRALSGLRSSRSQRHVEGRASEETPLAPSSRTATQSHTSSPSKPSSDKGRSQSLSFPFGDLFNSPKKGSSAGKEGRRAGDGSSSGGEP